MNDQSMSRRSFLRTGRTLLLASAVPWLSGCSIGSTGALSQIQQQTPHPSTAPDIEVALKATASQVSLLAGAPTRVWSYQGKVIQGSPSVMHHIPGSYLGPILRFQKGQTVRIHFTNDIPDESIIHWHGLHVPAAMDGHPQSVIKQGETFVYEFKILNRAGTYWFHPHPHGRTGPQVYNGLAGLFLVSDEEEAAVGLPTDAYDIPLVIQDRTFDDSNQFVYLPNGMMDQMHGFLGERILVNGQPDFILPVDATAYRIRLLNGSNSRIYRLAWNDGTPITVIGTDGGLLEKPIQRDSVVLAPAERIDVWRDFSTQPVGSEVQIRSLPFNGVETMDMMGGRGVMSGHGMMDERGMMQSNNARPQGTAFPVCTLRVDREGAGPTTLPMQLSNPGFRLPDEAINQQSPRTFTLSMQAMQWVLNGRTFEMQGVADNERVIPNTTEVWEFINDATGMMPMAHPMHIHGVQFQVIQRQPPTHSALKANWESIQTSYVEEGWKDTVLVMPGERVKVLLKFEDYEGLFLYHCHNLEHEDMGMMRNYLVQA